MTELASGGSGESGSFDIPVGQWTDVREGQMIIEGCYVDDDGVLRSVGDNSCVVWHLKGCLIRGIRAEDVHYDPLTRAPWCFSCWQKKKIQEIMGSGADVARDAVGGVDDTP